MTDSRRSIYTWLARAAGATGLCAAAFILWASPARPQSVGSAGTVRARQPVSLRGTAPELVGGSWLNTEKNAPVTLASLRGKVTILHFWTFG